MPFRPDPRRSSASRSSTRGTPARGSMTTTYGATRPTIASRFPGFGEAAIEHGFLYAWAHDAEHEPLYRYRLAPAEGQHPLLLATALRRMSRRTRRPSSRRPWCLPEMTSTPRSRTEASSPSICSTAASVSARIRRAGHGAASPSTEIKSSPCAPAASTRSQSRAEPREEAERHQPTASPSLPKSEPAR
jgi:hypothetical protein